MQLIDSLDAGGAERMAVNIANALVGSNGVNSFLCATRQEGPLKASIADQVSYLFLKKKTTIDITAIWRLRRFVSSKEITIIHAHSSSFFLATLVKLITPHVKIVWHDHYGNSEALASRRFKMLKWCSRFFSVVISVNLLLKEWAKKNLRTSRVTYLPNFAATSRQMVSGTVLKGMEGKRIICLANLRPQKDHITLIMAFKKVLMKFPDWTLHLVGKDFEDTYAEEVKRRIIEDDLGEDIFCYGSVNDIQNVLGQATIGVLSSRSEGLPVSLLEYGLGGLPVIVTEVGECGKVVIHEENGLVVPPENPILLAEAMQTYIENEETREKSAQSFKEHIDQNYSEVAIIKTLLEIYDSV
ncbi:glycosyltransferase family 4 protein [Sungkyunkwania multivorans]|uniref:Glycosyltransferase family 4 protein n=1 Tax=Sungkyunkwania multivorans TaxID=1173618 RepID=A0ABW3D3Q2_9FLAO